ncbi:MAG: hypothetical protein K2X47_08220 [Bdellovibrionales bacterium]|nr:hypothetical protein [Bdellovibrionales bacterium]
MKTLLLILFVLTLKPAHASTVGPGKIGVGLMLGSIVSMTGKYWLSERGALDFGIGVSGRANSLYGDYLWHVPGMFGTGTRFGRETSGYFGGGLGLGFWSESYECGRWNCSRRTADSGTGVFLRGLFGAEWYPPATRFGVFLEIGPTLLLTPATSGGLDLGLGGRYYF